MEAQHSSARVRCQFLKKVKKEENKNQSLKTKFSIGVLRLNSTNQQLKKNFNSLNSSCHFRTVENDSQHQTFKNIMFIAPPLKI